jgi:hypothetical protein
VTEYTLYGSKCEEVIEGAYQHASKMLLEILLNDYDLIGRLRSVLKYFVSKQTNESSLALQVDEEILHA